MPPLTANLPPHPASRTLPEHSRVRLRRSTPGSGLIAGAAGTVVHVYREGAAYEVEFTDDRNTPILETLLPFDVEPLTDQDG